jgi:hypothetical protein
VAQPLEADSPLKYFTCHVHIRDLEGYLHEVKPGMTLEAGIILEDYSSCFVVPSSAVSFEDSKALVHILSGDSFIARPVELGAAAHGRCTILSGVEEGELLALSNPYETRKSYLPEFGKGIPESNAPPSYRGTGMRAHPQ